MPSLTIPNLTMPHRHLVVIAVIFASLLPLHAQQTGDRVAGQVVSSFDGRPIAHATVTLVRETTVSSRSPSTPATATADDTGHFSFAAVPPGKYMMRGTAPGYVTLLFQEHDGFYTAVVTGAGLATDSLILQLDPASTISGHILNEAAEPVQNAQLTLYRELAGHITRARNAQTDTDGAYEFDKLSPGRYFLTASGNPWYAVHPHADQPNQGAPQYRVSIDPALDVAYPLLFYPRALDSDGAAPITLAGGNQVTADIQMSPTPAITLNLRLPIGIAPGQQPFPQLTRSVFGSDDFVQIQMMDNVNGMMRISGLAPGQYTLRESTPDNRFQLRAAAVDLTTGPTTLDIGGHIDLATIAVTVHAANGESLPAHLLVSLRSDPNRASQTPVNDKNIAEIPNVPLGDYRFTLYAGARSLNVLTLAANGKPIPDKLLHITASGNIPVDITVSAAAANIDGFARRDGKPAPGSLIVLVPAGGDTSEDLFRRDQSNLDGGFDFANVAPGPYLLVAIDDGWTLRWNDAATLTPYLLHAIPISVPATGSATIHISEPLITQPR